MQWRRGDAVLLAEANVEPDQLVDYFGDAGGSANRLHMLFDFMLNGRLVLALARQDPEPIIDALRDTPALPDGGQWATFLRNHDEIDLSRLTAEQRDDVFAAVRPGREHAPLRPGHPAPAGPDAGRRPAPPASWRTRCSSPCAARRCCGTARRSAWARTCRCPAATRSARRCSGPFAQRRLLHAPPDELVRPVITDGEFGYEKVNVTAQRHDPDSLLAWFERMIRTLREAPEIGSGQLHARRRADAAGRAGAPRRRRHRHDAVPAQPRHRAGQGGPEQPGRGGRATPTTCWPIRTTATRAGWTRWRSPATATAGSASAAPPRPSIPYGVIKGLVPVSRPFSGTDPLITQT